MRNEEVVIAFSNRERAVNSTGSLSSTGNCLYSYSTCIAEYNKYGRLYINLTKYSTTTSHHQTLVKRHLLRSAYEVLNNVERDRLHIISIDERI